MVENHHFQRNESTVATEDYGIDSDADLDRTTRDEDEEESIIGTRRQVGGAAVAGGIAGFLLLGPLVGALAAGGAAAIATSRGKAGEVVRASGDAVADAGSRLQKFDQKHSVTQKTSQGFVKSCRWMSKQFQNPQRQTVSATAPTVTRNAE
jgi:hypothetical protein